MAGGPFARKVIDYAESLPEVPHAEFRIADVLWFMRGEARRSLKQYAHELHEGGQTLFITMECVKGQDLKGLIKECGRLTRRRDWRLSSHRIAGAIPKRPRIL